jgi:ATP-dependent exoDNAse (exonuclease V) beta subunit
LGWAEEIPEDGSIPGRDFNVQIHRIAALSWAALEDRKPQPGAKTAARMEALYNAQPVRRTAVRREITVSELCSRLDPLLEQRRALLNLDTRERLLPPVDAEGVLQEQSLQQRFGILTHRLLTVYDGEDAAASRQADLTGFPHSHRRTVLQSALTLCRSFFDSRLGRLLAASGRQFWEHPFLSLYQDEQGPLYISGQIDLAFEAEGCTYLVDFKTDSRYKPGEHDGQLALYAQAVREQTGGEVRPYLFLLRSAEAVPSDPAIEIHELITGIREQL